MSFLVQKDSYCAFCAKPGALKAGWSFAKVAQLMDVDRRHLCLYPCPTTAGQGTHLVMQNVQDKATCVWEVLHLTQPQKILERSCAKTLAAFAWSSTTTSCTS